jgi:hypothetical protein
MIESYEVTKDRRTETPNEPFIDQMATLGVETASQLAIDRWGDGVAEYLAQGQGRVLHLSP